MGEDRPAHVRISRGWGNVDLSELMDPWTHQRGSDQGLRSRWSPR